MKSKKWIIIGAVALAVILLIIAVVSGYNGLVEKEGTVDEKYAEIQTQLQRRADLIPNFVATVKGYTEYEKETLTAVTEARSAVAKASNATELANADEKLDSAISVWVNAVTEAYPELKANANYIALQDELAGTENRIAKARNNYNEIAADYNIAVRKFPKNIIAGIFGFDKKDLFKAAEGSEQAPIVSFD